jgi:hypothetical protein
MPFIDDYKNYMEWYKGKIFIEDYSSLLEIGKKEDGMKNAYIAFCVSKNGVYMQQLLLNIYAMIIKLSGNYPVVWCFDETNDFSSGKYGVYDNKTLPRIWV